MSLTAAVAVSSCLRSRSSACAFFGSFQSDGSSESALSSSSRFSARSQSKKPPQQHQRLLDFGGDGGDFGAHGVSAPVRVRERYTKCGTALQARRFSPARS
jgi:hypothetical protein